MFADIVALPHGSPRTVRRWITADGDVIGFSNPMWILKEQPRNGIPTERLGSFGSAR
ncbi:hypothetical protein ACNTMW_13605 [Planosporangium sp. 12N6]|uniref:hypothetical protein n=1 Tax=Planosporangium spinosum TaxID=3402278 RepID=UPI003CF228F6